MSEFEIVEDEIKLKEERRKLEEKEWKKVKEYEDELRELKDDALIIVSYWSGLPWGSGGIFVTKNKELYRNKSLMQMNFEFFKTWKGIPEKAECSIQKVKELTEEEYEKISAFIENEIIDKEIEWQMIYDVGYSVKINYNGINKEIENDIDTYEKAKKLLNELAGSTD